jgi:hypothetical protein
MTRPITNTAPPNDVTLMRQLRAVRRAALQALEEARLAYQFAPTSYTHGALAQIELVLVRLAEIDP